MNTRTSAFRASLRAGGPLRGIFVRTPSHHVIEVLAAQPAGDRVDVVIIDCEHAPIDPATLDAMLAVSSALDLPALVRIGDLSRSAVQQALDLGATGIVVPHVGSAEVAATAVEMTRYGDGGRGYSPSTRSAGWGTRSMGEVLDAAAASTTVVVQIEDARGVESIDEIVAVGGVDAILLGRADMAVALGARGPDDQRVVDACTTVATACTERVMALAVVTSDASDAAAWRGRGATLVIDGTDQARLRTAQSPNA